MNPVDKIPGSSLKALNILHLAFLSGLVLFVLLSTYLVYIGRFSPGMQENEQLFQVFALGFAGLSIFFGNRIFKSRLMAIQNMSSLKDKINAYRGACIIRWALVEAATLFTIVCFMLTANYAFLALAVALIIVFMVLKPTKEKIFIQTGISGHELENI